MIPLSLAEVAGATGARLVDVPAGVETALVTGPVVTDSRLVERGSLFCAVPGEHVDGHDYAAAAVDAGAVAVLAARPVGVPALVVPPTSTQLGPAMPTAPAGGSAANAPPPPAATVAALGRLARAVVDRLPVVVVGVTGSSGKTGTKDLLAQVLPLLGPTVAPQGSYNNELGLPLTVLRCDRETRYLVLEMGARGIGHIAALCRIAPPRVGLVLNVGSAHVGEYGDRAGIAVAKGELVEALPPDGVAVLNADDPLVAGMAGRTGARVLTFGESGAADVRAEQIRLDARGRPVFRLLAGGRGEEIRLQLYGEHQASNALAAAAVALDLGLVLDDVADALSHAIARSRWRMQVIDRADGVTVVNDAYNANPESVRAALKTLVAMGRERRTWAVLGEMRELGSISRNEHDAIGRLAVRLDVSRLVVVGEGARPMHAGASLEGSWGDESRYVPDTDAAIALLREQVRPGDIVLVKASRAAGLEVVAEALLGTDDPAPGIPHGSGART